MSGQPLAALRASYFMCLKAARYELDFIVLSLFLQGLKPVPP